MSVLAMLETFMSMLMPGNINFSEI